MRIEAVMTAAEALVRWMWVSRWIGEREVKMEETETPQFPDWEIFEPEASTP